MLAIRNNEQLDKVLDCVTIAQDGVLPYTHPVLLARKTGAGGKQGRRKPSQEY